MQSEMHLGTHNDMQGKSRRESKKIWTQGRADFMIALVAAAWGSSYVMMKVGLAGLPPFSLTALRFSIAFVCVAAIFPKELQQTTLRILKRSFVLGAFLFGIFAFLLHGMETTTASNAGFLTSTAVVMVPVFHALLTRTFPGKRIVIGVVITITGIGFLSLQESLAFHSGDLLCLGGAFMYTCQILCTDKFTRDDNPLLLGIWSLAFAAIFSAVATFVFETPTLPATGAEWGAVLGLAIICSAFGFVMQSVAQAYTTPEHAALLFSLEPVSSAAFAFVFLQEVLNLQGMIGAALVLCGVLFASVKKGEGKEGKS